MKENEESNFDCMSENKLLLTQSVLFAPELSASHDEHAFLLANFLGVVAKTADALLPLLSGKRLVYLTGAADVVAAAIAPCADADVQFRVVGELVRGAVPGVPSVTLGQVPINVHNVGVLFRDFFTGADFFREINATHKFQALTESNKPDVALRTGLYMSNVEQQADGGLLFHLLPCSSNLRGPTENFAPIDRQILAATNALTPYLFEQPVAVNHVLAQVYHNARVGDHEKKARIARHSDKTHSVPPEAIFAFATFYSGLEGVRHANFDWTHGKTSLLTQLELSLKHPDAHPHLARQFRVALSPNSLFLMTREMNRLYTHEIKPSTLPVERLPLRLGYVMRCSNQLAVHRNGQTFVKVDGGDERALVPMTGEIAATIKALYFDENVDDKVVDYPPLIASFNAGDYLPPTLNPTGPEPANHSD